MSDIQRWYIQNPPGQPTEFVSYADHVAATRACEERVRRDVDDVWVTQHDDHITWEWKGDTGYALVQREALELLLARCNEPTYANGVQAARDAVEALPWTPTFTDLWVIDKADALVAIEALKEQP